MTLVGTALNLGEKMNSYPQVLTLLITPQIWLFHVVVLLTTKEMDKSEKRTCRACKAIVFAHLIGSLSNDNGDGNENVISKYTFALF